MCGRFTLTIDLSELLDMFSVDQAMYDYAPRYNIAPSQTIAIISNHEGTSLILNLWNLMGIYPEEIEGGNLYIKVP
ncbi:SOS response-associated peptidase family protein [Paenibacillus graminis]|uniref:SOS response-associated peptidase family protein n=1 Tax=Paenibacillus graminis TaxID=189425 RepID=UPI000FA965D7